ncbi:Zinc metalloproteinase nas-4 [Orchesella cincta]|uniref:Metalloendopeptidase n=1 Tax=Orchesella cincta TaxID=48709 RepID=A0A1D2M0I1_ORCCI|nr:Zinc metalloproteinase nas-4 [Orchesella cincta]
MNTGAQFAKFGGSCVSPGTMVHELGHTLCMGHEQTRRDRDEWISFNTAICQPHGLDGPDFDRGLNKLYDYVSIEHYEGECYNGCFQPKQPGVTKCGSGGPLGVLDVEILNEMYGCNQGCLGYRYVNINNNPNSLVPIGEEANGDTLYSCRAYHQGDIVPGKYHAGRRECHVSHGGGEHSKTGAHIEVLTAPMVLILCVRHQPNLETPSEVEGQMKEKPCTLSDAKLMQEDAISLCLESSNLPLAHTPVMVVKRFGVLEQSISLLVINNQQTDYIE